MKKELVMNNVALLIVRATVGALLAGHGSQKLFGWFEGSGLEGTEQMMEKQGLRPARTWALIGVIGICVLTPYNDYVLNNGAMVGNNLPIGAMLYMFILAVAINGPLSRFAPRKALCEPVSCES